MTPELKTACEVIFQEHKLSSQIKWNKEVFRGRISLGLSDLAKDTLVKKNIIVLPGKSKKIITLLNPDVATATSFEEAEKMIANRVSSVVITEKNDRPAYIPVHANPVTGYSGQLMPVANETQIGVAGIKWYMKPLFYYVVWPLCAAIAGALISWLIDFAYTELFLNFK